jgi:hypothetical protein
MTISAAGVSDGDTSSDSTLSLTFTSSEATTGFAVGDIIVTNATLSSFVAVSSTVYTATLTPSALGAVTIDVAASTFTDAAGNANTAATQFNWTFTLVSPLTKANVTDNIEAWSNLAKQTSKRSVGSIENRMDWLRRHEGEYRLSHQGINFSFRDKLFNTLLNTDAQTYGEVDITKKYYNAFNTSNGDYEKLVYNVSQEFEYLVENEAAKLLGNPMDSLKVSGSTVVDDWSIWTGGEVTVGHVDATGSASKQRSESQHVTIGIDKPTDDGGVFGYALAYGLDDVDVGTTKDAIKSENISLSAYGSASTDQFTLIEGVIGVGNLDIDTKRIDGANTFTGTREANQVFASVQIRTQDIKAGNLTVSSFGKYDASRTRFNAFTETGGAGALTFAQQSASVVNLSFGTDIHYLVPLESGVLIPFTKLEFGMITEPTSTASMNYEGESTSYDYSVSGNPQERWRVEVGADMYTHGGWSNTVSFETGKNNQGSDIYRTVSANTDLSF